MSKLQREAQIPEPKGGRGLGRLERQRQRLIPPSEIFSHNCAYLPLRVSVFACLLVARGKDRSRKYIASIRACLRVNLDRLHDVMSVGGDVICVASARVFLFSSDDVTL